MPAQKARARKEWYSVSVDTLRGMGLLALLLVVLGVGFVAYRIWENRALEREAARVIDEVQGLIQRLQKEERTSSYRNEVAAAWQSFQDARSALAAEDFRSALDDAKRSRNVLLSILDALKLPGTVGQAQFISIQGEVQYRRGEGGAWEEARSRVALHPGDFVRTSEHGSAEIMFLDGTLYTVRPNTQFIVSAGSKGQAADQAIEMDYGWVDLNTAQTSSNVKTPGAVARVKEDSEAFVAVDKDSNRGRFGAFTGGIELSAQGGMTRQVEPMQQVVQTGDLLSEPSPLPGRPEPVEPADNLEPRPGTDAAGRRRLGPGAGGGALCLADLPQPPVRRQCHRRGEPDADARHRRSARRGHLPVARRGVRQGRRPGALERGAEVPRRLVPERQRRKR